MPFLAAAVAVLTVLVLVLLSTCAHLLARIIRLEAAEREYVDCAGCRDRQRERAATWTS